MVSEHVSPDAGLRDYLGILRRRKRIVVLSTLLAVGAALVWSFLQPPVYAGRAEVLLQPRTTESPFDPTTGVRSDPVRVQQTEIRIVGSQPIRAAVRDKVGEAPAVSVRPLGQTDLIEIRADSEDAGRAAEIANAYATAYIDFRRTQAVDDVLAAAQQIRARIDDLQRQIDLAPEPQRESLLTQQGLFRQKLDELQVDAALKSGGAQLVTQAAAESSPVSPRPVRNAVVAGIVGLLVGFGLAFLVDYLDDSVKSKDEVERITGGVPVIGMIPAVGAWKTGGKPRVIAIDDPTATQSEAYRTLRTSIQFLALEHPMRALQITSPGAEEGKTTTLANLGITLAGAGHRVVIVCCDLRRPRVHEFFGLDNSIGFTSVLLGAAPLSAALQQVPAERRLSVLASGSVPPNPSELLSSSRTLEVFTSLQAEFDIVLIDSPPVLPVTDALVLSGQVDATLVVSVAGVTTRKEIGRTVEMLRQVDAPLVGIVLNGVSSEGAYGYGYRYERYEPRAWPKGSGRNGRTRTGDQQPTAKK